MLLLKDLIALSPEETRTRSRSVAIFLIDGSYTIEDKIIFKDLQFIAKDLASSGPPHLLRIKLFGPGDSRINEQANVSCDCENYLFNYEVANTSYHSSSIEYSNGAYPKITNPNLMPGLCKHLYAASLRIKQYPIKDSKGLLD